MSDIIKILAFAGSTREGSFNKKLIRVLAASVELLGVKVTLIDLKDFPMPLYDGDLEATQGIPQQGLALKKLFLDHQGLMISSPEYNSSVTGVLKNAIDWVSRSAPGEAPLACFAGKYAALTSASPGAMGGIRSLLSLRSILEALGVHVIPQQFALGKAHEAFDEKGNLKDAKQFSSVQKIAERFVHLLRKVHG